MNIYDIAKKAGVSIATISRVINGSTSVSDKTRKKVTDVMQEMGYTPNAYARGLMGNSMKTIGIMTIDVRDLYFANAIHTIEIETRKMGYNIFLCSTGEDIDEKKKYLKLLLEKRVDGIILVGSVFKEKKDNSHILETAKQVPVVMVNGNVNGENVYCITCDDFTGTYDMARHLIKKGHKDIIYIYDADTFSGFEKLKGFRQAASENNINLSENSIIKVEKSLDGSCNAIKALINKGVNFTAVITSEDILGSGAIRALRGAGFEVPRDVAVTGYNNSIISRCTTPELTSVDGKVESLSSSAVKLLIDILEGKNVPVKTTIMPELVIREST